MKRVPIIDINTGRVIRERKKNPVLPAGWKRRQRRKDKFAFERQDGTTIIGWTRPKYKGWYIAVSRDNPYYTGEEDEEEMDIDIYEHVNTKEEALNYAHEYMKKNNEENNPFW
jgi:hypothetical protein